MNSSHLPSDFALQSSFNRCVRVAGATVVNALIKKGGRGAALCVDTRRASQSDVVISIDGMLPDRFYRTEGLPGRFVRADSRGVLTLVVHISRRALIAIVPVI